MKKILLSAIIGIAILSGCKKETNEIEDVPSSLEVGYGITSTAPFRIVNLKYDFGSGITIMNVAPTIPDNTYFITRGTVTGTYKGREITFSGEPTAPKGTVLHIAMYIYPTSKQAIEIKKDVTANDKGVASFNVTYKL